MKKTYISPCTAIYNVNTSCCLLEGSPIGTDVKDKPASSEHDVLSRRDAHHFDVWDDEEEEDF